MSQSRLTDEEIQKLIECIESGADVPGDMLPKLSPNFFEKLRADGKFDYKELDRYRIPTLEYSGKRSEAIILAQSAITGGAAPLQIVRSFANGKNGDWKNLIVQGDNLQFLKTCYMNHDLLIRNKIKGKVKLVYIDPPFATKSDFQSSEGEQSYSDKIERAEFLELLREGLIYLKELLSPNGSIYIHLDYRMTHYVKLILDELFGKENFRSDIVWQRSSSGKTISKQFPRDLDYILWYSRSGSYIFNSTFKPLSDSTIAMYNRDDNDGRGKYRLYPMQKTASPGPETTYDYKDNTGKSWKCPAKGWRMKFEKIKALENDGRLCLEGSTLAEKAYWNERENEGKLSNNLWNDISNLQGSNKEILNYPTQKPEALVERIVTSSSNKGDLVLDCFAGSGTTAAVAEKLGRRWVVCDFGKHAIYTIQKRILNIADSKKLGDGDKVEKYNQPPNPFCVVSAGAYDFSKIMNLRENKDVYVSFVLGLFGIIREDTDFFKKFKLPNIFAEKDGDPVEVYPIWEDEYLKEIRIDEEYLQGIISASKGKLKGDYFIITPETCTIIGNTTLKNENREDVKFHMLKFPYKVLEDVSRQFQIEEQPSSSADINKLISSTGFYFNEEVSIKIKKEKDSFKIEQFSTKILNSKNELFSGLDGLAMILIDVDYDGKIFDMDEVVYGKDIDEAGVVKVSGLSDKTVIIAVDKHGNESKIIKV